MGMGFGMWIFWILIILVIIFIIKLMMNSLNGTNSTSIQNQDPLEILKKRYASGEISSDEYDEMKNKLE